MPEDEWVCERCDESYHTHYDEMRPRFGEFSETVDGATKRYQQLCEDCHRVVVRS